MNGDAIHGTRPWHRAARTAREGIPVRFTTKGARFFVILLGTPEPGALRIRDLAARADRVDLLGHGVLGARPERADLVVAWPAGVAAAPAYALACEPP